MPSKQEYAELAHRARNDIERDSAAFQECRCPGNLELVLFLGHWKELLVKRQQDSDTSDPILGAVSRTYKSVKTHTSRVYSPAHLKGLYGTGPSVSGVIKDHLWSIYPPEPPSEEDLEIENRQQQAAAQEKKKLQELNRKRKAEDKAAAVAAAREGCTGGAGPNPLRGGLVDENNRRCISPGDADDEQGNQAVRKKTKTARAKKEYVPQFGSANWVFLLMLIKHLRGAKTYMTKAELMDTAEASGLSHKPIKGSAAVSYRGGPPTSFVHDGWSNFPLLCNREPPLCVQYSNPKKIKLTSDGEKLALRLYHDAVDSGRIDWRIPGIVSGLGAGGMSQQAPSLALPQAQGVPQPGPPAKEPSRAFTNTAHTSRGAYSQHGCTPPCHGGLDGPSYRGRGLEPQGPSNSPKPSWRTSSSAAQGISARAKPSTTRVDLISHPSSSFRIDNDEPDLSQRLSQSQSLSQPQSVSQGLLINQAYGSQPASQGIVNSPAYGTQPVSEKQPFAEQQSAKSRAEERILSVMQIADCSYARAQKAMKGFCTVEGALEKFYDRSDSDSDDNGNDLAHVGSQHMHHISDDYDVAMGASQSTDHMPPANHMDISQGRRPGQKHPARAPPAPSTLTHPSSLKVASASHAQQLSQTQQMSQDQLSLGRQPSRNLGSGLGRAGSAGGVGPSRLGATGQGRASGSSQQASQGVGHIEAAQLESSGTSWKLPFLGSGDRLEEKDIRLPPISPRACFGDEYELVLVIDSREQYSNSGKDKTDSLARHVQTVRDRNIEVEVRTLQQGDVLWIAKSRRQAGVEYVLDYVLERKRVDDLHGSIISRRYDKQKYNMNMCGLRHLMYLVEGDPDTLDETSAKAVKTATLQTEIIDGFQMLRSEGCNQTMSHLVAWTKALKRKYDPLMAGHPQVQRGGDPLPTFEAFKARSVKASQRTVQDVWGLMLTSVPGWSGTMVEAVVKQYGTPLLLFRAYEQAMKTAACQGRSPLEAARQLLMSCQLSRNRRPISANNSAKVFDSLFANGWQCV